MNIKTNKQTSVCCVAEPSVSQAANDDHSLHILNPYYVPGTV